MEKGCAHKYLLSDRTFQSVGHGFIVAFPFYRQYFAYRTFLYYIGLSIFEAYQCIDDDADDGQSKNRFFNVIGLVFRKFYVYLLYIFDRFVLEEQFIIVMGPLCICVF